ncbi:MAG: MBL fold metallo-hydrolase [Patescibacteria group bacterium]|nr:MBL fold metallo-hydrolase [Patescibacteria group bacterium]
MKLTILGSGTTDPSTKRNEPGYLLEIGRDLILMDAGSGTKEHIIDAGYDDTKINYILITHTHVDHVADLPALFWNWWVRQTNREIVLLGPKKIKGFIKKMGRHFFLNIRSTFVLS